MAAANVRTWTGGAYWNLEARSYPLFGGLLGGWTETGRRRGVGLLEVNEKKLRKELTEARSRLDRDPDNSWYMEKVARCLRWLSDPEANELFGRAAARYEEGVRE